MSDSPDKPIEDKILEITLYQDYQINAEHYLLFNSEVTSLDDESLVDEVQTILEGLTNNVDQDISFPPNVQEALFQFFFKGILTPDNRKILEGAYILVYGKGSFTEDVAYRRVLFTPNEVEEIYAERTKEESEQED